MLYRETFPSRHCDTTRRVFIEQCKFSKNTFFGKISNTNFYSFWTRFLYRTSKRLYKIVLLNLKKNRFCLIICYLITYDNLNNTFLYSVKLFDLFKPKLKTNFYCKASNITMTQYKISYKGNTYFPFSSILADQLIFHFVVPIPFMVVISIHWKSFFFNSCTTSG